MRQTRGLGADVDAYLNLLRSSNLADANGESEGGVGAMLVGAEGGGDGDDTDDAMDLDDLGDVPDLGALPDLEPFS